MISLDNSDIIKKAVDTFGKSPQMLMAIEEMSELIQALSKYDRAMSTVICREEREKQVKKALDNISEEIADVEITLAQLRYIFDNAREVDDYCENKLSRLNNRIENIFKI